MTRKIAPILHEIVTAIEGIQGAVAGKTFADFQKDWLLRHGAQRAIEIISEASRHVPAQLKAMHPNIRWRSIAGIGNVLRHEYHAISDQVIWKVILIRPISARYMHGKEVKSYEKENPNL